MELYINRRAWSIHWIWFWGFLGLELTTKRLEKSYFWVALPYQLTNYLKNYRTCKTIETWSFVLIDYMYINESYYFYIPLINSYCQNINNNNELVLLAIHQLHIIIEFHCIYIILFNQMCLEYKYSFYTFKPIRFTTTVSTVASKDIHTVVSNRSMK